MTPDDPPIDAPWTAAADHYWEESRQPLTSLVFIAPLLAIYEAGVLVMGPEAVRNGADVWLRSFLDWLGLGQYFFLPALTIVLLVAWHHLTGRPWRVARGTLYGMAAECVALAVCLWIVLQLQGVVFGSFAPSVAAGLGAAARNAVMFLGAGIYEELLFRLILLSSAVWLLRKFGIRALPAVAGAVVATSLVFSAAHYVGPYGEPLEAFSFAFRFIAGVFFSVLFALRGFGIAVGAHAAYDLLVGLW